MSFLQLIYNVLANRRNFIIAYGLNTILLLVFYYLLKGFDEFIYPLVISGFIFLVFFIIEVIKYKQFVKKLVDAKVSPDVQMVGETEEERLVFGTIKDIHKTYYQRLYELEQQRREGNNLFSQWIHNMKTSITIIELACNKQSEAALADISEENDKLKANLEECLNVLRLDDFSRDYIVDAVSLRQLVVEVVNKKKSEFIYQGVFPVVEIGEEIMVHTDKKWCRYVIEQLLLNAIKYSPHHCNKHVYLIGEETEEGVILRVKDEGIGIAKEDIPRVFQAFFTGDNGRNHDNATGIGLYMVKKITKKLGHTIAIQSEKEQGTEVRLSFLSKM